MLRNIANTINLFSVPLFFSSIFYYYYKVDKTKRISNRNISIFVICFIFQELEAEAVEKTRLQSEVESLTQKLKEEQVNGIQGFFKVLHLF